MTSILTSHSCIWPGAKQPNVKGRLNKGVSQGCWCPAVASGSSFYQSQDLGFNQHYHKVEIRGFACLSSVKDFNADNSEDENSGDKSSSSGAESKGENNESFRQNLERTVGADDSTFSGLDLATLIRRKYGRSYDVQFIKKAETMGRIMEEVEEDGRRCKEGNCSDGNRDLWLLADDKRNRKERLLSGRFTREKEKGSPEDEEMAFLIQCRIVLDAQYRLHEEFMGRNLLALNVMWKYMEQKSFPLTEEEYILRLDDVANTLRCWGAVSHIRNSLANSKERPRIGKAVSIFIDMDESGGRSDEWIYK